MITEIFIISWFARHFYRRHVGDIPIEEIPETPSDTGSTLTRQRPGAIRVRDVDRLSYGSTTQNYTNTSTDQLPTVSSHVDPHGQTDNTVKSQLDDIFGPEIAGSDGPLSIAKASVIDVDVMKTQRNHNAPVSGEALDISSVDNKALDKDEIVVTLEESGNETFT